MAQVEDVAVAPARLLEHASRLALHHRPGGQGHRGVEVALDAELQADPAPRLVQGQSPIHRDRVAAGRGHRLQQVRAPGSEVDAGDTGVGDPREDPLHMGEDPRLVVAPAQRAHPGVEELEDVDAGGDLGPQVADGHLGELLHQLLPQLGLTVHQRLAAGVVARGMALDEVGSHGERGAREADHRGAGAELLPDPADGGEEVGSGLLGRFDHHQAGDVRRGAERLVDDRSQAGVDGEGHAHPDQRQHDVRVEDRGVDAELVDGHHGHPRAELRRPGDGEDVVPLAQLAVGREAATRLAHEPDRGPVDGLASECGQHPRASGHRGRGGAGTTLGWGTETLLRHRAQSTPMSKAAVSSPFP